MRRPAFCTHHEVFAVVMAKDVASGTQNVSEAGYGDGGEGVPASIGPGGLGLGGPGLVGSFGVAFVGALHGASLTGAVLCMAPLAWPACIECDSSRLFFPSKETSLLQAATQRSYAGRARVKRP